MRIQGEGSSRNMYKGHMEKAKGGRVEGRRWQQLGGLGVMEKKNKMR